MAKKQEKNSKKSPSGDTPTRVTSNHFPLHIEATAKPLVTHRVDIELPSDADKKLPDQIKVAITEEYLRGVARPIALDRALTLIAPKDLTASAEVVYNGQKFLINIVKLFSYDLQHLLTIDDQLQSHEALKALESLLDTAALELCERIGRKDVFLHKDFYVPLSPSIPTDPLVLFKGHSQRVHLTNKEGLGHNKQLLSVSFDARACVGLLEMSMEEYLVKTCNVRLSAAFTAKERAAVAAVLGGLEVTFVHKTGSAQLDSRLRPESAREYKFELGGDQAPISVEDYFRQKYKLTLKYPHAPLVKHKRRKDVFPLEILKVAKQTVTWPSPAAQVALHQAMIMKPNIRIREISRARDLLASSALLKEWGVAIAPTPVVGPALVLEAPILRYAGDKEVTARRGAWNLKGFQFFKEPKNLVWGVVNCADQRDNGIIAKWASDFALFGRESLGVACLQPASVVLNALPFDSDDPTCLGSVTSRIRAKNAKLDFVIVIKATDELDDYQEIKRHFDKHGIVTQCVVQSKTPGLKGGLENAPDYWANLWAKIQTKCGRDCHFLSSAAELWRVCVPDTAIVGADLCHPILRLCNAVDRAVLPSFAALVCSSNRQLTRFTSSTRIHLGGSDELFQMKQMITSVMSKRDGWPGRIIYLRDGISDGQIQTTMRNEVQSILAAYRAAGKPPPLVTAASVRKRHHTRLFRANWSDEKNVEAGTLCLSQLAKPSDLPNFLMVAQHGSMGTSKPIKYQILRDDIGDAIFSAKNLLQKRTALEDRSKMWARAFYELCHLHGTSQKAVSLPAPITWAHKLADRMRVSGEAIAKERLASVSKASPIGKAELDAYLEEMNRAASNIEDVMPHMYWI